jgi:hypothetical protein
MSHFKPILNGDESIADIAIVTTLVFTLLTCLILIGIF